MQEHQPGSFVPDRVLTDDGKIQMAPEELLTQSKHLEEFFTSELKAKSKYKLITKRDVTTHNSWTHNIEDFASGERITNYLYMHSDDAQEMGLSAKDLAKVSTTTGSIILPVKYLDCLLYTSPSPRDRG